MYIVLGATGHIGSALAQILLDRELPVTVVTRSESAGAKWEQKGARAAIVDVHDVGALRAVLARGKRAYLLNPRADPASDTAVEERVTVRAILAALEGSGLQKVVAQSTYGAQPGAALGDLGVLYDFEQGLAQQAIPAAIIRGAYYMSNRDMALASARTESIVDSFFPAQLELPMVAARDVAKLAARLLTDAAVSGGLFFAEGPARYTSADVAAAFGKALGKAVTLRTAPQEQWLELFKRSGFSEKAAQSMTAMTRSVVAQGPELPAQPVRGETTLEQYIAALVGATPVTLS